MQKSQNLAAIESVQKAIMALPDLAPSLAATVIGQNANYLSGNKVNPYLVELRDALNSGVTDAKTLLGYLANIHKWVTDNIRERGTGNGSKIIVEKFTVAGVEYSFCNFVPDFASAYAILSQGDKAPDALAALFADIPFENDAQKVSVFYDAKVHIRRVIMQPLDSVKSGRTRERKSSAESGTEGVEA